MKDRNNAKKFKKEGGITLIALIITIIILVILAAVSIRAVYNMGIVGHAINGTQQYAEGAKAENKMLGDIGSLIDNAVSKIKEIQAGEGIALNKSKMGLQLISGQTVSEKLTATLLKITGDVEWTTSNPEIATVGNDGTVTAVAVGKTTITAKVTSSGKEYSATCEVEVTTEPVTNVELNANTGTLDIGQTLTLTATVTPSTASNQGVTWSTSDSNVATVANGVVTAVGAGSATITATANDGSGYNATCAIMVNPRLVSSITLNETTKTLNVGDTLQLTATVAPDDATNKSVTWSSSDSSVAEVAQDGEVTAVAAGNATITATAADGSGKTATCVITVNAPGPVLGDGDDVTPIEYYSPMAIQISGKYKGILYKFTDPSGDERDEDTTSTASVITGDAITNRNLKNNTNIKEVRQGEVPIPAGFYYVGGTKDTGLVISDNSTDENKGFSSTLAGNEFVWVPVPDVIYNASDNKTPQNPKYTQANNFVSTGEYREPDIVSDYDNESESYLKDIGFKKTENGKEVSDVEAFSTEMKNTYKAMIESVNKYKGFYVARYELGLDSQGNPVSKNASKVSGITTAAANNSNTYSWYGLYNKCKEMYEEDNTESSVTSTMIWGSQYDAMMNWMSKTGKKVASTNSSKRNKTQKTGSLLADQVNKVYDLYGCHYEWTLEAYDTYCRVLRGGYYTNLSSVSPRSYGSSPGRNNSDNTSRPTLYIR